MSIFNKILNFASEKKDTRKNMLSVCLNTHDVAQFKNTSDIVESIEELIYVEQCMFDVTVTDVKMKIEFTENGITLTGESSGVSQELSNIKQYRYWGMDNIVIVKAFYFKEFLSQIKGLINIALSDEDIVRFFSHKSVNYYEFYTKELEPRKAIRLSLNDYLKTAKADS